MAKVGDLRICVDVQAFVNGLAGSRLAVLRCQVEMAEELGRAFVEVPTATLRDLLDLGPAQPRTARR